MSALFGRTYRVIYRRKLALSAEHHPWHPDDAIARLEPSPVISPEETIARATHDKVFGISDSVNDERNHVFYHAETTGFKTREEYEKGILVGNENVRSIDIPQFEERALYYLFAKSLRMGFSSLVTCADGRISGPTPFAEDPLMRFCIDWKPLAGTMISSDLVGINKDEHPGQALQDYMANNKETIFATCEALFSGSITRQYEIAQATDIALRNCLFDTPFPENMSPELKALTESLIQKSGKFIKSPEEWSRVSGRPVEEYGSFTREVQEKSGTQPVVIELQSHSHLHDEHDCHGCGAHGSNTPQALQMTAINALVLEQWLKEQHAGISVKIVRTHHLTGDEERVVNAESPEYKNKIHPEIQEMIQDKNYSPVSFDNEGSNIVREKKQKNFVDTNNHDEYIIRFSAAPLAHAWYNSSVLEQSLTPDMSFNTAILTKLISIAQNNRIKKDREKGVFQPIFVRLDSPAGINEGYKKTAELYEAFFQHVQTHASTILLPDGRSIQNLIDSGELMLERTITRPHVFTENKKGISFKTTIIPEGASLALGINEVQTLNNLEIQFEQEGVEVLTADFKSRIFLGIKEKNWNMIQGVLYEMALYAKRYPDIGNAILQNTKTLIQAECAEFFYIKEITADMQLALKMQSIAVVDAVWRRFDEFAIKHPQDAQKLRAELMILVQNSVPTFQGKSLEELTTEWKQAMQDAYRDFLDSSDPLEPKISKIDIDTVERIGLQIQVASVLFHVSYQKLYSDISGPYKYLIPQRMEELLNEIDFLENFHLEALKMMGREIMKSVHAIRKGINTIFSLRRKK